MKKQPGFTLPELVVLLAILSVVAVGAGGLYVLIHFLVKFW